jgi:hypothetical protein
MEYPYSLLYFEAYRPIFHSLQFDSCHRFCQLNNSLFIMIWYGLLSRREFAPNTPISTSAFLAKNCISKRPSLR